MPMAKNSSISPLAIQDFVHNLLWLVGVVILIYDHVITFGEERYRLWRSARNGTCILLLVTRYFALCTTIVSTYSVFAVSLSKKLFHEITLVLVLLLVGTLQSLRVYALYSGSKRIAALMTAVGLLLGGVCVWGISDQAALAGKPTELGCHAVTTSKTSAIYAAMLWEALLVYDVMVFFLTIYRARKSRHNRQETNCILYIMYRDGAIYFCTILFANGANAVTYYACPPPLRGALSTISSSISVAMISRMTLHLYRIKPTASSYYSSTHMNAKFTSDINLSGCDEDASEEQ